MKAFKTDKIYNSKEVIAISNRATKKIEAQIKDTLTDCKLRVPKSFVDGSIDLARYDNIIAWFQQRPNIIRAVSTSEKVKGVDKAQANAYRIFLDVADYLHAEAQLNTDREVAQDGIKEDAHALGSDLNTSSEPFMINEYALDWKRNSLSQSQLRELPHQDALLYENSNRYKQTHPDCVQMNLI